MTKTKEKKVYEFTTGDGKYTFKMLNKVDGKACSISGAYPVYNQLGKLTRKQTEKMCVELAIENGWLDGNKK